MDNNQVAEYPPRRNMKDETPVFVCGTSASTLTTTRPLHKILKTRPPANAKKQQPAGAIPASSTMSKKKAVMD